MTTRTVRYYEVTALDANGVSVVLYTTERVEDAQVFASDNRPLKPRIYVVWSDGDVTRGW